MRSLGFGLECIGLLVLRLPYLFAALALVATLAAGWTVPSTSFDGRLVDILSENQAFQEYESVKSGFRDASRDAFLMVRSPDLLTVEGINALRFLHIDLSLAEAVDSVYSVFSLGDPDFENRTFDAAIPTEFADDAEVAATLNDLVARQPAARALIAPEAGIAIMVVTINATIDDDNDVVARLVADLEDTLAMVTPDGFEVALTGIPAIQTAVADALRDDQWRLGAAGLVIGLIVGFIVFRSLLAAVVCAAPAGIAVIWLLGVLNIFSVEINFLFAILPSLALILALVDSIVFYFHWQSANADNGEPIENLKTSILRIGPASAMTSITTALAFASLAYAQNPALQTLAWLGVASVVIAFLAFIVVLPLACLLITRLGFKSVTRRPSFTQMGSPIGRWALKAPVSRALIAIGIAVLLGVIHFQVGSNFVIERYLPPDNAIADYEATVGEMFGGTVPLYAVVPLGEGENFYDDSARARIAAIDAAFESVLGEGSTISLATIWESVGDDEIDAAIEVLAGADPGVLERVLSRDQRQMLVTAQLPSVLAGDETSAVVGEVADAIAAAGFGDEIILTGFPVLSGIEIPALVNELRVGLLIAIGLAVAALAIASGSIGLALASVVPNVLPILSVEAVIWLMGQDHDLTSLIALTVAFGIGIDNAIHMINMYRVGKNDGLGTDEALSRAVSIVGPALMASTAILGISYLATQISAMPSISLLGQLIIATLVAALIANLVFLPSFIAILGRAVGRRRGTG